MSETEPGQTDLRILGQAFGQIRRQHGSSITALAAATGTECSVIDALEAGALDADYELLVTLARGLGVQPAAFFLRAEEIKAGDRAASERG